MHYDFKCTKIFLCRYRDFAFLCKPVKHQLPEAIVKLVTPIFNRLTNESFLEGCKNVSNQNANKSFNVL